jgi:hypothetical protein
VALDAVAMDDVAMAETLRQVFARGAGEMHDIRNNDNNDNDNENDNCSDNDSDNRATGAGAHTNKGHNKYNKYNKHAYAGRIE